ncbi:MAG: hypothetical protein ACE5E8_11615, partial [Acidimicrobiia bacterium]
GTFSAASFPDTIPLRRPRRAGRRFVGTKRKLFGLAVVGTVAALLTKMFGKKSATEAGGAGVPPVAEETAES